MNPAHHHLTLALEHLHKAECQQALAVGVLVGSPRTQQATDALNDILEAARSIRVLRDGLAADSVTPPEEVSDQPSRGSSTTEANPISDAAASAVGTAPTGSHCIVCHEAATGFRGPDAFCPAHMPEDD